MHFATALEDVPGLVRHDDGSFRLSRGRFRLMREVAPGHLEPADEPIEAVAMAGRAIPRGQLCSLELGGWSDGTAIASPMR